MAVTGGTKGDSRLLSLQVLCKELQWSNFSSAEPVQFIAAKGRASRQVMPDAFGSNRMAAKYSGAMATV